MRIEPWGTCSPVAIYAYCNARRASGYKWFFLVFFYKHHPCQSVQSVFVINKTHPKRKKLSFVVQIVFNIQEDNADNWGQYNFYKGNEYE